MALSLRRSGNPGASWEANEFEWYSICTIICSCGATAGARAASTRGRGGRRGWGPRRRRSYYTRAGCLEKSTLEMLAVLVSMGMPARSAATAVAAESRGPEIYFYNYSIRRQVLEGSIEPRGQLVDLVQFGKKSNALEISYGPNELILHVKMMNNLT
ncbi:hypothetical protein BJ912DRAFT_1051722 [Pholiota molesta]|nr:hypothetical protein BJ912DRAFT_1051722 [Pholiota molesta]